MASGKIHEFSFAIGDLDRGILEANARALESSLVAQTPEGAFEDGYRDGWGSVAGNAPVPANPTRPPPDEIVDMTEFQLGFEYGRADALKRFKPGSGGEDG